jgi:hypothetical protein
VRLEAVRELENILRGGHPARLAVALDLLKRLAEDDSRRVATAALESLKTFGASAALPQVETAALDKGRDKDKDKEARDKAQQEEAARRQAEGDALAAQVAAGLATAQAALGRGALDDAREPIARVLRLAPQNADAIRLQETLHKQIEERARLEEGERRIRELRQRIGTLIARANAAQPHDEAIALLNDTLSLDPEHSEVKDLLEERHRLRAEAEAAERRARSVAVVKQRIARHLERGDLDDAERALANTEPLAAPAEEFAPLRQRLAELREVRRREAEEAARQRAEAERRAAEAAKAAEAEERKRKEIEAQLAEASRHLTRGNLTNAIVLADVVLELDPEHVAARTLHGEIQRAIEQQKLAEERAAQEERARAEAEGAARQERAAEQARREIEVALQKAAKRLRRDDYAAALGLVDGVLARDGQHAAALELRTEIERASEEAAAHPATGFSLPPTLTAATIWVRANALQSNTFRIVGGVVLAVVIGVSVWQPWSRTAPAAGPNQTAPVPTAPTPAPQAPEPKAEPKTEPKTEPPPETKALEPAPENIVARDERVLAAERRARRQIGAGNPEEALKSITQGLAIDANDETLLALLRDIARDAQGRAMRAMRAAEKVGSVAVSSKEFAAGKVAQVDADRLHEAGQHQPAIKAYLDAARYFTKAAEMTPPVPAAPFQPPPVVVNPPAQSTSMSAVAAATEAIDGVRKRYEAAFANRSVEELRALWPSMSRSKQKAYSDHFKDVRSLKLELKCQQPVFEYYRQTGRPVAATMWCSETQVLVSKAGGFTQRTGATATFWLRSDGPRWVISDAQHMHIAQK